MTDSFKRKVISWLIIGTGLLVALVCVVVQYRSHAVPKVEPVTKFSIMPKKRVKYSIETLGLKNRDYTEISGWIFVKGQEPQKFVTSLVLYTKDSKEVQIFPLKMEDRNDVAKMSGKAGVYNYMNSGFHGYIPIKYMTNEKEKKYKIGFLVANKQQTDLVKTGIDYKVGGVK